MQFAGLSALGGVGLALSACGQTTASTSSKQSQDAASSSADPGSALAVSDSVAIAVEDSDVASFYEHVKSVTALATTLPAGEKIVGVAIEYDGDVAASSIDAGNGGVGQQAAEKGLGTYQVLGRSITGVTVAATASIDAEAADSGPYVIVALDPDDAGSQTLMFQMTRGYVGSNGPVGLDSGTVRICQRANIASASGTTFAGDPTASRFMVASSVANAVADQFVYGTFDDEETGYHAAFELKEPENYDSSKSYPLVLFLPDAGVTTTDPHVNLRQGLGAVAWAVGEQFVLTVAGTCADVPTCLDLIDSLVDKGYGIDTDRLIGTGESAGCMALITYAADHPDDDRFAALMLVAGQGNMTPIAKTPLAIFVSEDDESSYGGMSDAASGVASIGVGYEEVQLDCSYDYDGEGHTSGKWVDYAATGQKNPSGNQEGAKLQNSTRTMDDLMADLSSAVSAACEKADSAGEHIVYFHVKESTLDGTDSTVMGGNTHNFTWQYAYNIPELRDWVIAQTL